MPWFRSESREPSAEQTAERIRGAITSLTERRDEAASAASAALLGQAQVQHALRDQHRRLREASDQLDDALALARRVADDTARDDGELAALPFRMNVDGLEVQRDVVLAAAAQIDGLEGVSEGQVDAARALLVRSRAEFDHALHAQLALLVTLERLERSRAVLAARTHALRGREQG